MPRIDARPVRRPVRLLSVVCGTTIALALVACTPSQPQPEPSSNMPSAPASSPAASPTPTGPVLVPEGSAADNLALFREVVETVAEQNDAVEGRAYIDALVAAGFDKSAMEVTHDRTTVDNPADSIQFSVLWQGECLVGQVGPSVPNPTAVVLPELPDGGCLVGATRDIDW